MKTQISPMLAVNDGNAAIAFYKAAFGAALLWRLGDEHVVAGLAIEGAQFFLAHESPPHGTRSPASVSFTTVRIELIWMSRSPCTGVRWPPARSITAP